jgi:hypothetical protein
MFVPCRISCGGRLWRIWMRHWATTRKVAGSIPGDVHVNISLTWSFRPHCDLGVDSAANRNVYQEYFWGWMRPVRRADNFTTFMCRLSWNMGTSNRWNRMGLCGHVQGLIYLYCTWCAKYYLNIDWNEKFLNRHCWEEWQIIYGHCICFLMTYGFPNSYLEQAKTVRDAPKPTFNARCETFLCRLDCFEKSSRLFCIKIQIFGRY